MNLRKNQTGFSLIELLVAILVLSVIITAFAVLFTQSFQGVYSAGYKSEAQYIGQEAMENLLADITFAHPDATVTKNVTPSSQLVMNFTDAGTVTVTGSEVTVTVQYTDANGTLRTQVFKSFIPD